MKTKVSKLLAPLLAGMMLLGSLAACGNPEENPGESGTGTGGQTDAASEGETADPAKAALDALGEIDYGGRELAVLYDAAFKNEVVGLNETVDAAGGNSQVINDAVYTRNSMLEDRCNLKFTYIDRDTSSQVTMVQNEASAPTGDFQLIDARFDSTSSLATNAYLYDLNSLGMNFDAEWWDKGTADFALEGGVYFMSGTLNIGDDGVTYVLIFNKVMQKTYANTVPNPYDTVRAWEWTLDHFNEIIQGVSKENGDGKWDELDTYGFITTWEYGNTFFIGSDLRYVINDETVEAPTLYLSESGRMEKAVNVLETAQKIYHDNNASYMSPPGEEVKGVTAFKESRGMFFGEIVNHLATLNKEMQDAEYGIVPVPKYDKAQEFYRTWSHESGSTFSVTSAIPEADKEVIGKILEAYAILSHQYLKPAYYDTVLTSRNVKDPDSAEMMDLIFQNRVCDMGFYFRDLGFYELFKSSVNDENVGFTSAYQTKAKGFDRQITRILRNLQKKH